MKFISARVPEALATRLKVAAAKRKTTAQALITDALVEYLKREKADS